MKVDVINGSIKWGSTMEKESQCEYYRPEDRGGCTCTTQTSCLKCRFINPCTGFKNDMLSKLAKVYKSEIVDLENEVANLDQEMFDMTQKHYLETTNLNNHILAMEIFESTHCGEF